MAGEGVRQGENGSENVMVDLPAHGVGVNMVVSVIMLDWLKKHYQEQDVMNLVEELRQLVIQVTKCVEPFSQD